MPNLKVNDELVLDIAAFNGSEKIKKWERKNIALTLGQNQYLPDFDQLLIGKERKPHYQLEMHYVDKKTNRDQQIHFEVHNKSYILEDLQSKSQLPLKLKKKVHDLKEKNKDYHQQIISLKEEMQTLKDQQQKLSEEHFQKLETLNAKLDKERSNFEAKLKEVEDKAKKVIKQKIDSEKKLLDTQLKEHKKYGSQKLLESVLPIINNFRLACSWGQRSENSEVKNYTTGFANLVTNLENVFKDFGISKILPHVNDDYNPELHFAVETVKSSIDNNDKIEKVIAPGFILHDRTIIPAKVIVGKYEEIN